MKSCPKCGSSDRVRKKRNSFQRLIPSKKYLCRKCNINYYWIKGLNLSLKTVSKN